MLKVLLVVIRAYKVNINIIKLLIILKEIFIYRIYR